MAKRKFHGQIDLTNAGDLVRAGYGVKKTIGGKEHILLYVDVWEKADDKKNQYADHDISLSLKKEQRESFPQNLFRNFGSLLTEKEQSAPVEKPATAKDSEDLPF